MKRVRHYKLENVYFGVILDENFKPSKKCTLYETKKDGRICYQEIGESTFLSSDEVKIYCTLTSFTEQQEISVLLLNKFMKRKDTVTTQDIEEIKTAAQVKKQLGQHGLKVLCSNSSRVAGYICDQLGFNLYTSPSTGLIDPVKAGLENVTIPRRKLVVIRRNLADLISISLLLNESVEIYKEDMEMDEILKRVFHISRVAMTPSLAINNFKQVVYRNSFPIKEELKPDYETHYKIKNYRMTEFKGE